LYSTDADAIKQLPVYLAIVKLAFQILNVDDLQLFVVAVAEVLPNGIVLPTYIKFTTPFLLEY
jgi:hypothetical protein